MTNKLAELVELKAQGVFLSPGIMRPMIILKGQADTDVLPVWISQEEFSQTDLSLKGILFHRATAKVLKELGYQADRCEFVELVGHHQFVDLHFVRGDEVKSVRCRADEAISMCLALGVKFFATVEFIEKCRNLNDEMAEANANMAAAGQAWTGQQYLM